MKTIWRYARPFFTFLGIITFLVFVLIGVAAAYGFYLRASLEPSAKDYANKSIRAVITAWSEDELVSRSSPELRADTTKGQLEQAFVEFKKLGNLQSYKDAEGDVGVSLNIKKGLVVTATYLASVTFEHGKGDVRIVLIRHDDVWQIRGFHLDPP